MSQGAYDICNNMSFSERWLQSNTDRKKKTLPGATAWAGTSYLKAFVQPRCAEGTRVSKDSEKGIRQSLALAKNKGIVIRLAGITQRVHKPASPIQGVRAWGQK